MKNLDDFIKPLKQTNVGLSHYVDFKKVAANVDAVAIKLNQLNYLIGQQDMAEAVKKLWAENPKAFSVLDILIAVRPTDKKKAITADGSVRLVSDFFNTPENITTFLDETGLTEVLRSKQINNLVDYVFGIEVGLDSNARKNRGGHLMENLVADILTANDIPYAREINYNEFPAIAAALGADKKRFDFVVTTPGLTYLIETNFYASGGSKLNEVARAYSELAPKINSVPGFEFVWITDGIGWKTARSKLAEAYKNIPSVYNLTDIRCLITEIKSRLSLL
ncbi:MAG: type II restriction endonuclease [Candidatus Amulumruptor caecigallinarius]|nr:type II restriction endonuclease [Candidatus Amulumruptor caecigallinarius]MCM1396087.1 type II restriction endonuclease [Candidatus Amulumruptor caecigallinarius]MCM1453904.1 type II restriction endonuclease [bacterium]